jgi:hypothetical protein
MNEDSTRPPASAMRSPFWACAVVFAALLTGNIFQCANSIQQRSALKQNVVNVTKLVAQAELIRGDLEPRLESLSLDLIKVAENNSTARDIVTQFRIRWSPGAGTASPAVEAKPE